MSDYLTNPHDRFFKDLFSRQEAARDYLQHYLPDEVVSLLDLSTLEIRKDSFVDPDLQEHFSDLLYKVTLQDQSEAYIYLLLEHKSYPDPQIAFQLLRYMVRIWDQDHRQNLPLQPILPLVIYHGRTRWNIPLTFTALLNPPEILKPYMPDYQYILSDLSQVSDEEIRGQVILQVGLLLLKYMVREDFPDKVGEILSLLRTILSQQRGIEYLETILRYIAGGTERISETELADVVTEVFREGENLMPTLAEQWVEQGREEGRQEGREEGREEAAIEFLERFLNYRFQVEPGHFRQTLEQFNLEAITRLNDLAFEAQTLAEFETVLDQFKADAGAEPSD